MEDKEQKNKRPNPPDEIILDMIGRLQSVLDGNRHFDDVATDMMNYFSERMSGIHEEEVSEDESAMNEIFKNLMNRKPTMSNMAELAGLSDVEEKEEVPAETESENKDN